MRTALLLPLAMLALLALPTSLARADVLPECPEGERPDCSPSEHHHGCGGCVEDEEAESSGGCSVSLSASPMPSSFALAPLAWVLVRRRRGTHSQRNVSTGSKTS